MNLSEALRYSGMSKFEEAQDMVDAMLHDTPETSPHLSAAELLIPATRYYIGRMTIHTTVHAQALARGWRSIPQNVRNVIRTDLEDAFRRDDAMRADPVCSASYYPLGGDVDREAWEEVRKAWLAD